VATWRMKLNLKAVYAPAGRAGAPFFVLFVLFLGLGMGCSAQSESVLTQTGVMHTDLSPTNTTSPETPARDMIPTATLFRLASPSPIATSTEPARPPTATPTCQDGLRYLADITVPDGTIVAPGEAINKKWQVENNGSCNWNERYRLRRISGPPLDLSQRLAGLQPTRRAFWRPDLCRNPGFRRQPITTMAC
jgi:hypothetical protein